MKLSTPKRWKARQRLGDSCSAAAAASTIAGRPMCHWLVTVLCMLRRMCYLITPATLLKSLSSKPSITAGLRRRGR